MLELTEPIDDTELFPRGEEVRLYQKFCQASEVSSMIVSAVVDQKRYQQKKTR
jgi:hypothetical protein